MTRGYYYAVAPDGSRCPHRHYELSRALAECSARRERAYPVHGQTGIIRYVDADGNERPARLDELAELEARGKA